MADREYLRKDKLKRCSELRIGGHSLSPLTAEKFSGLASMEMVWNCSTQGTGHTLESRQVRQVVRCGTQWELDQWLQKAYKVCMGALVIRSRLQKGHHHVIPAQSQKDYVLCAWLMSASPDAFTFTMTNPHPTPEVIGEALLQFSSIILCQERLTAHSTLKEKYLKESCCLSQILNYTFRT